jgi:hypothetical protein
MGRKATDDARKNMRDSGTAGTRKLRQTEHMEWCIVSSPHGSIVEVQIKQKFNLRV